MDQVEELCMILQAVSYWRESIGAWTDLSVVKAEYRMAVWSSQVLKPQFVQVLST